MSDVTTSTQSAPPRPGLAELFFAFVMVSLSGFGGALPWARRKIVDQKRWMTAEEFNEAFALAQFLPGPNVVNFSVVFGTRFAGAPGGVVTLLGLMGPPLVLVTILAWLYDNYGGADIIGRMLSGILAAAIGLMAATMIKMAKPLFARGMHWSPVIALIAFVTVGLLHWSLPLVAIVLAPISVALAWVRP